jgi:hypothetical protein
MTRYFLIIGLTLFGITGCGNLSPRHDQKIDNKDGKIGEIETLQNSMKLELGKLQSQAEISNSRLDRIQQGLVNIQQTEENNGVQIFSGTGGLVTAITGSVCILTCMAIFLLYYRSLAKSHEKTANLLAERIATYGDPVLVNSVFEAAMHTNVQGNILSLMKKHTLR